MKFETVGFHPIQGHALNVVEQINQTWTYVVALAAARHLLEMHPEAGGYVLAPGAHAAIELDIMSEALGLVGAEAFAAVDPKNNNKLELDLQKLAARTEHHRYLILYVAAIPRLQEAPAMGAQRYSGVVRRCVAVPHPPKSHYWTRCRAWPILARRPLACS
jgi:hypothetical protein